MNKVRTLAFLSAAVMLFSAAAAGCSNDLGDPPATSGSESGGAGTADRPKVEILVQGWVNTPTDEKDPFKKWVDEKYGIDCYLTATADFANQVAVKFSSDAQPDIVSFGLMTDFLKIYEQGSLVKDWTPYLDSMPNFKKVYDDKESAQKLFTIDGKLSCVWTTPAGVTWSLKIRKDWMEKMNLEAPKTPADLLELARKFTNEDPDGNGQKDTYGFISAGAGSSLGTISGMVGQFFGDIWYVDPVEKKVTNGIVEGWHKDTLDYIRQIVSEELIDPNWFVQDWSQKTLDTTGKIGIDWYPGALAAETDSQFESKGETADWWDTYELPKADNGAPYAGMMPAEGEFSHILSVSAKAALDKNKMEKIVKLIDDVMQLPDGTRPEAYDALRWAVGVEPAAKYQPIEGTDLVYCYTGNEEANPGEFYWGTVPGGWDWGSWFSIPQTDGVVQGNTPEPSAVAIAVAAMDAKTAALPQAPSLNMLNLDATIQDKLTQLANSFEYNYVSGKTNDYDGFVKDWLAQGGQELLDSATEQLKEYGML